jgi:GxxExxY protein
MTENEISYSIIGAAYDIHNTLGPGLLESVYQAALEFDLDQRGLITGREIGVPVIYNGQELGLGFRMDLLVENKVVVEIKSVENLHPVHFKQLLTYLRLSDKKLGLLINFGAASLKPKEGIFRIVNGL